MSVTAAVVTLLVIGTAPSPITAGTTSAQWFDGIYQPGVTIKVPYPASLPPLEGQTPLTQSVADGVASTIALQDAQTGLVVEMGASQGALVLDQVMVADAKAGVPVSDVSFVLVEDEDRGTGLLTFFRGLTIPVLNYAPTSVPVTPYAVTVVVKQFDGMADFPNNPLSPGFVLAAVNAVLGANYYHGPAVDSDLADVPASNITVTVNKLGGVTTTYLVPTATLPLITALGALGVPTSILNPLNTFLTPIINSAYHRGAPEVIKPKLKELYAVAATGAAAITSPATKAVRVHQPKHAALQGKHSDHRAPKHASQHGRHHK